MTEERLKAIESLAKKDNEQRESTVDWYGDLKDLIAEVRRLQAENARLAEHSWNLRAHLRLVRIYRAQNRALAAPLFRLPSRLL